jgi:BirA family transcriptional regulator, biotin operon repressor / biotin---[acetyl-CoA-carboxylase] ligase
MIGAPHVHHRVTDSTNERAKALARAGAPHGTLVTADEQTAGRGRQGRRWAAPPGAAVLMSVVLREVDELLPLAAAVATCEALEPLEPSIKWPNDVWLEGRKLAGLLVEGRPQEGWAVVGIGLNVDVGEEEFPLDLRESATSLRMAGLARPVPEVRDALVDHLEAWLGAPAGDVLAAWRERDALCGRAVRWNEGEGTAAGIDDSGSLLVDTDSGRVALAAGEVHPLRPA